MAFCPYSLPFLLFFHLLSASRGRAAPAPYVRGYLLLSAVFPDEFSTGQESVTFSSELRKVIHDFTGIDLNKVLLDVICLRGCEFSPVRRRATLLETGGQDLNGLVEVNFFVDGVGNANNESDGHTLRRFGGVALEGLQKVVRGFEAKIVHGVFKTSSEMSGCTLSQTSSRLETLSPRLISADLWTESKSWEGACSLATLEGKILGHTYGEIMIAASRAAQQLGAGDRAWFVCRQQAATLLSTICTDSDDTAIDDWGNGCFYYSIQGPGACGLYDTGNFRSASKCCMCGGGLSRADLSASARAAVKAEANSGEYCTTLARGGADEYNLGCKSYEDDILACGSRDTSTFKATAMCCECGGGSINLSYLPPTPTPTTTLHAPAADLPETFVYLKFEIVFDKDLNPSLNGEHLQKAQTDIVSVLGNYLGVEASDVLCQFKVDHKTVLAVILPTESVTAGSIESKLQDPWEQLVEESVYQALGDAKVSQVLFGMK